MTEDTIPRTRTDPTLALERTAPWQIAIETLTDENDELRQILNCNRMVIRACIHALHDETRRGDTLRRQNRQLADDYREFRERLMVASLAGDDA